MTEDTTSAPRLSAFIDILLPGSHGFPPASATGTVGRIMAQPSHRLLIDEILVAAGGDFVNVPVPDQISIVSKIEERLSGEFQALLAIVYSEYYSDPAVLQVIAAETGYRHPPQPFGYVMPDFDDSILDTVKKAPSSWRREPVSSNDSITC